MRVTTLFVSCVFGMAPAAWSQTPAPRNVAPEDIDEVYGYEFDDHDDREWLYAPPQRLGDELRVNQGARYIPDIGIEAYKDTGYDLLDGDRDFGLGRGYPSLDNQDRVTERQRERFRSAGDERYEWQTDDAGFAGWHGGEGL